MGGWDTLCSSRFAKRLVSLIFERKSISLRDRSLTNVYYLLPRCVGEKDVIYQTFVESLKRVVDSTCAVIYPLKRSDFDSELWQTSAKLLVIFDFKKLQHGSEEYFDNEWNQICRFIADSGRVLIVMSEPSITALPSTFGHVVREQPLKTGPLSPSPVWTWDTLDLTAPLLSSGCQPTFAGRMLLGSVAKEHMNPRVSLIALPVDKVCSEFILRQALPHLGIDCVSVDQDACISPDRQPVSHGDGNSLYCLVTSPEQNRTLDTICHSNIKAGLLNEAATVVLHKCTELGQLPTQFAWSDYFSVLSTRYLGRTLLWTESLGSSWDFCDSFFNSLPSNSGLLVVSNHQMHGKGRGTNKWISPLGQAAFTFHVTLSKPDLTHPGCETPFMKCVSCVQHLVSLAIVLTFKHLLAERLGLLDGRTDAATADEEFLLDVPCPALQVRAKWPNDVYVVEQHSQDWTPLGKLAGTLVRCALTDATQVNALIGVGLNVTNKHPAICLQQVLDQIKPSTTELTTAKVIGIVLNKLERLFDRVTHGEGLTGLTWAMNLYTQCWMHSNQIVEVHSPLPDSVSELPLKCTIVGVDDFGYLRVHAKDSATKYTLHPDGNSMDMMRGLIVQK